MAKAKLTYKDMTINDIIDWCVANDKVEWLQNASERKVPCKVYPRKKVAKLDEEGNPVVHPKTGKIKMVSVADKSKPYTLEDRPISFIQLRDVFVNTFMPEIKPVKKEAEPTMYDKIKALKTK